MRSKNALKNIISSLIVQLINIICGLIIPRLIISTYGSNVNGLTTSIAHFLAYISLVESGFGPVIRANLYKPIANKDKQTIEKILKVSEKIFRTISYIFILYVIFLCIVLPTILKNEFNQLFTLSLVIIIAINTFIEYYFGMTYSLYLHAEQKKYVVSTIQILTLLLNTIVIFLLVHLNASIQIVKLISALIFVLRPLIQNLYVRKKYNLNLEKVEGDYKIKQMRDGLIQHFAYVIHTNTDVMILTLCSNLKEVSVYSIYLMVIEGVKKIVQSFSNGVDAMFGDIIAKDEKDILDKSFKIYEGIFFTISSIVFCSTVFLIIPFVKIYTQDITDVNYIRPIFAVIFVLTEFIFVIRQLYYNLIKVTGHFKETKVGALIEAISNIVISFTLVWRFGLIGIAIGTLCAMIIRTVEIIYYVSKNILKRKLWYTIKRVLIVIIEFFTISFIVSMIPKIDINGYGTWGIKALTVTAVSTIIILLFNCIIYKENLKSIVEIIKKHNL